MRTGCVHYSASMIKKLYDLDPEIYVAGNQHKLYPPTAKIFRTYLGVFTAIINTVFAAFYIFFFVLFKKLQHRKLFFYFPAFHPWNYFFVLYGKLFGIESIQTIHDYRSHVGERNPIIDLIKMRTISLANEIIFLSEHERQLAIAASPKLKNKSHVLLHPLLYWPDLEVSNLPFEDRPNILMLGRINAYKGLDLFTKAIEPIKDRFNEIVVAGKFQKGLKKYKRDFIRYIDRYLTEKEIAELLGQFHILVLPYSEATQSGVLPLGVQAGLPMVISKVGGIPEQIDQSSAIFTYPNYRDIGEGLEYLLNEQNYNSLKSSVVDFRSTFENRWEQDLASIVEKLFT